MNPLSYTEKRVWIEKFFGIDFVEKLIICSNKGLVKGAFLIDDYSSFIIHADYNFIILQHYNKVIACVL